MIEGSAQLVRCSWAGNDPDMLRYHDEEWGLPQHDDRALFELLTLEGAQAGLSWLTILRRRESYRRAFAGFDIERVASYTERDVESLVSEGAIVRHRGKIESTISNARVALKVIREEGSLGAFLWSFVDGRADQNSIRALGALPAETEKSRSMSVEMKRRGFRFVGPTICCAFMQAAGLVNDHVVDCFRYDEVQE